MSRNVRPSASRWTFALVAVAVLVGSMLVGCGADPTPVPPTEAPAVAPTEAPAGGEAGAEVWLGNSIRSLSNPYHAAWDQGGQLFADAKDLSDTYQVLLSEGDNTKQLDDIKALIAKAGKDVVFNVDPNENSNAVPIAEIMEDAEVYWVSQWNKPPDAHPRDYKYWIAHMAADDYQMGYDNAKLMFEELGGEGKVVHIQGMLGNAAAQGREDGFRAAAAEYPDIEILDVQTADWDQTKAQNLVETWLVKFPEIDAIHTAGDMHALGALAAIKAGRPDEVGKILISGVSGDEATTKAILAGEIFSTSGVPAHWQGGMGLSIPYAAYLGLFDPGALPPENQEFYFDTTLVTADNAQQWLEDNILGEPQIDWDDWWGNVLRPMEAGAAPPAAAGAEVWLGNSIRSLSNPYHAAWDQGGQLFADAKGLSDTYQVLLSEGDNTKQLDDIKALIAKAGKDVVFNVDPNENSNAVPIAEIMEDAEVYWVSQWNKPPDAHPRDYKYWIAHMAADDYQMGYDNAKLMFEELGGEGKVVHIQGMLGNAAAQGREDGFRAAAAEYPGIEILDVQTADWDQTKAQNLVETWLVKFPEIDAIHTAGDMHALGALAAIKAGRPEEVGKILISGVSGDEATTKAILDGEIFSTSGVPAHWQGGMGLSIPYAAYLGLVDPEALSPEQQEFYFDTVLITADNAQQWLEDNILGEPQIDWDDWWGNILRPMEAGAAPPAVPEGVEVWLGNSIRSLSNPYHAAWDQGGQLFADAKGLSDTYQVLLSEGDNTKQLDDIKALIAKAGKDVVFNVDPNENSNAVPIAEIMEEAEVYWVSQWNKPPDAHPRDFKYWIAHMAADDYQMGYDNAKLMFEELGGEGKVVHIQGMLGNAAAQGREDGFRAAAAEYPGIEILDVQTADWDQTKAQNLVETWLVKFPEIDAIHTAGDMHALGALAAIKAGRPEEVGKILISGVSGDEATTKAILDGEIFSTSGVPAHWQGGMGLSIPYAAYLGLFDPAALSPEQQEFYFATVLITADNAQEWLEDNILGEPQIDWDDWWGNILRPMEQ